MEWWGWLLAACGAIVTIYKAVDVVAKIIKPVTEVSARLKNVELHDERDIKRFDRINGDIEVIQKLIDNELREMHNAVTVIVMHEIYGNHDNELKETLTKLQNK